MTIFAFLLLAMGAVQNCLGEEEHMPETKDPVLPPDVITALESAAPDSECEEIIKGDATAAIRAVLANLGSESEAIEPCGSCYGSGYHSWTIIPGNVKVAPFREEGLLIQAKGEFKEVLFNCTDCHIMNDEGANLTGTINVVWTGGKLTFTIYRSSEKHSAGIEFYAPIAEDINLKTVSAICEGSKEYQDICKKTHESGELDHNFRNKAEEVFSRAAGKKEFHEIITLLFEDYLRCKRPL